MKFNEFYCSFDAQPYLKKNEKEQKKKNDLHSGSQQKIGCYIIVY